MSYGDVEQQLLNGEILILDGGIGTELERRGIPMDPSSWCGSLTIDYLEELKSIHKDYISAGADIITANTYASSRLSLEHAGVGDRFEDMNRYAVETADRAREESGRKEILIAGSVSHRIPIIPGTSNPDLSKAPTEPEMTQILYEHAAILKDLGCDLILLEMMYDPNRMKPAFKAAKETGLPVWAGFSVRRGKNDRVLSFVPDKDVDFEEIIQILEDYDIFAAGIMHTPSNLISDAISVLRNKFKGPLIAYPDSGYFKMPNWQFEDIISPKDYLNFAKQWVENGVQIVGGCCGLSPKHIEVLADIK